MKEPPFGSDGVPARYLAAWEALLCQCPPGIPPFVWWAAIYDAATMFGDFGALLDQYGWSHGDLFDVPRDGRLGGLAWRHKGETVRALGAERAFTETGRVFDRKRP